MSRFWTFTQRTDNPANCAVEANGCPAAPPDRRSQFGPSFTARHAVPAAVAHPSRSPQESAYENIGNAVGTGS